MKCFFNFFFLVVEAECCNFYFFFTLIATLALFTSYSASIVALLQSPSNFITSIDDLIASPLKVGIHQSGYARFTMRANFSGVREVYAKKVQPQGEAGWIYDPFVGVERVRTELFAFQVDSPSAYKAISRTFTEAEKCSLSELQMIILPRTTILVERNSGYKELIRQRCNDIISLSCSSFFSRLGIPRKKLISQFYSYNSFFY